MPGATERDFYDEVAEQLPSPQFIFLNYGYAEPCSESSLWIALEDQRHQYHLNLVKHVMAGVELTELPEASACAGSSRPS